MDTINNKFAMINYIAFSTLFIGLIPSGVSVLIPENYIISHLSLLLILSVFGPLVLFTFMDDFRKGFISLGLIRNILIFMVFFTIIIFILVLLISNIFNIS